MLYAITEQFSRGSHWQLCASRSSLTYWGFFCEREHERERKLWLHLPLSTYTDEGRESAARHEPLRDKCSHQMHKDVVFWLLEKFWIGVQQAHRMKDRLGGNIRPTRSDWSMSCLVVPSRLLKDILYSDQCSDGQPCREECS